MCQIRTVMLTSSGRNKSQILLLDSLVDRWLNLLPTQLKRTHCLLIGSFNLPIIRGGENRRAHIPTSCGPRQRDLKISGCGGNLLSSAEATSPSSISLNRRPSSRLTAVRNISANEDRERLTCATCCRPIVFILSGSHFR